MSIPLRAVAAADLTEDWVWAVVLLQGDDILRAWVDPEAPPGPYRMMVFTHLKEEVVRKQAQVLLDIRPLPEVDPREYSWEFLEFVRNK